MPEWTLQGKKPKKYSTQHSGLSNKMSPRARKDENLFEESTMSFGEHLDELRVCLIRAAIWLMIGMPLGFLCGTWVVNTIQIPLQQSLENFYQKQYQTNLSRRIDELRKLGYPETMVQLPSQGYLPEECFFLPEDLRKMVYLGSGESLENYAKNQKGPSLQEVDNLNQHKISSAGSEPIQFFIIKRIEDDPRVKTMSMSAQESFGIWFKASFMAGFVFASPGIFWSIWSFVAAGLYSHEKRYVKVFLPISLLLFLGGVLLAFFVVFRFVLEFLFMFNQMLQINPTLRISEWISFALLLPIGFGISFQLPLVMFFLERVGILSVKIYLSNWRISVLVIFFIAMILTPADPWSMLLMAMPLTFLYFAGVGMCMLFPRKKGIFDEEE